MLFVSAAPDDRPSTASLERIVRETARRPGLRATIWYLRSDGSASGQVSHDHFVVDDLRTWLPARLFDLVGLRVVGDRLRGLRLRRERGRVSPDVVVLDDGLGERVVAHARDAVRVVRINDTPPLDLAKEPAPSTDAAVWISRRVVAPPAGEWVRGGEVHDFERARSLGCPTSVTRTRGQVGIDTGTFVVVGWGSGGWLDGADLFVRTLWALAAHHSVEATGLWVATELSPDEEARLMVEAGRCGLGERFRILRGSEDLRCCGDAVLLPYRDRSDGSEMATIGSGLPVVAFAAAGADDGAVTVVADLDVEAAAAALARVDPADRPERMHDAYERLDVRPWVDELFQAVDRAGSP